MANHGPVYGLSKEIQQKVSKNDYLNAKYYKISLNQNIHNFTVNYLKFDEFQVIYCKKFSLQQNYNSFKNQ